jgi:glucose/arabinose dehydrogenase/mono/diheme cytochrome c family protein
MRISSIFSFLLLFILSVGCKQEPQEETPKVILPDEGNGGILLPANFAAAVVADDLGRARHAVVRENGDIYVHLRKSEDDGPAIIALRDSTGDGRADVIEGFSKAYGTGIELHKGYLYYSTRTKVMRSLLPDDQLLPEQRADTLVYMVDGSGHMEKPFAFDGKGNMLVNIGSFSNACQQEKRTKGSPGIDPCVELETRAGIWRFSDDSLNQQQTLAHRYATGIRNAVAITWNDKVNSLYVLQHGRDDLHRFWPDLYTEEDNLELPAEELLKVDEGDDFGWPYCYWDQFKKQKLLNPEYGGGSGEVGRCENIEEPLVGFPRHWGPNDLLFYQGDQFPEKYKNGAFIAFHGSWNRLGHTQAGYNVVFQPVQDGVPSGKWEVFADGFKGGEPIKSNNEARFRPCGLAEGPDGSLYVVDSQVGRIWRIMYYPEGVPEEKPAHTAMVQRTDEEEQEQEPLSKELASGKAVYDAYCLPCHMENGKGAPGMNPPLVNTDWVTGDKQRLINVLLDGLSEPVEINGEIYQNAMASHAFLSDQQIADVLTFIRNQWGNEASAITPAEVAALRKNQ